MALVYTLNDYKIIKQKGFEYTIPDDSRELITLLANLVGSPNYSKSPYFIKSDKKKKKTTAPSTLGWEMIRNFKKTNIKDKTDTEKQLDTIRIFMNKLSEDTYPTLINNIKETIHTLEDDAILEKVITYCLL